MAFTWQTTLINSKSSTSAVSPFLMGTDGQVIGGIKLMPGQQLQIQDHGSTVPGRASQMTLLLTTSPIPGSVPDNPFPAPPPGFFFGYYVSPSQPVPLGSYPNMTVTTTTDTQHALDTITVTATPPTFSTHTAFANAAASTFAMQLMVQDSAGKKYGPVILTPGSPPLTVVGCATCVAPDITFLLQPVPPGLAAADVAAFPGQPAVSDYYYYFSPATAYLIGSGNDTYSLTQTNVTSDDLTSTLTFLITPPGVIPRGRTYVKNSAASTGAIVFVYSTEYAGSCMPVPVGPGEGVEIIGNQLAELYGAQTINAVGLQQCNHGHMGNMRFGWYFDSQSVYVTDSMLQGTTIDMQDWTTVVTFLVGAAKPVLVVQDLRTTKELPLFVNGVPAGDTDAVPADTYAFAYGAPPTLTTAGPTVFTVASAPGTTYALGPGFGVVQQHDTTGNAFLFIFGAQDIVTVSNTLLSTPITVTPVSPLYGSSGPAQPQFWTGLPEVTVPPLASSFVLRVVVTKDVGYTITAPDAGSATVSVPTSISNFANYNVVKAAWCDVMSVAVSPEPVPVSGFTAMTVGLPGASLVLAINTTPDGAINVGNDTTTMVTTLWPGGQYPVAVASPSAAGRAYRVALASAPAAVTTVPAQNNTTVVLDILSGGAAIQTAATLVDQDAPASLVFVPASNVTTITNDATWSGGVVSQGGTLPGGFLLGATSTPALAPAGGSAVLVNGNFTYTIGGQQLRPNSTVTLTNLSAPDAFVTRRGSTMTIIDSIVVTNRFTFPITATATGVNIAPGMSAAVLTPATDTDITVLVHNPRLAPPHNTFALAKDKFVTRFPEQGVEGLVTPVGVGTGRGTSSTGSPPGATVVHVTAPDGSSSTWATVLPDGSVSTAPIVAQAVTCTPNITAVLLYPPPFSNATVTAYAVTKGPTSGSADAAYAMTACDVPALEVCDSQNYVSWTFVNTGNIPLWCVSGAFWNGDYTYVYLAQPVQVFPGCSQNSPVPVSRHSSVFDCLTLYEQYFMAAFLTESDATTWATNSKNYIPPDSTWQTPTGGVLFTAVNNVPPQLQCDDFSPRDMSWLPAISTPSNTPSAVNPNLCPSAQTLPGLGTQAVAVVITGICGPVAKLAAHSSAYDATAYLPSAVSGNTEGMIIAFVNAYCNGLAEAVPPGCPTTTEPEPTPPQPQPQPQPQRRLTAPSASIEPYYPLYPGGTLNPSPPSYPTGPLFLMDDASDMLVVTVQNKATTVSLQPWLFTLPYLVMFPPSGDQPPATLGPFGIVTATTANGAIATYGASNAAAVASAAVMVVNAPPATAPASAPVPAVEPVATFVSESCGLPSLSNGNQLGAGLFRDCATGAPMTQCPSTEADVSCCIGNFATGAVGEACFTACNQAAGVTCVGNTASPGTASATLAACETMAEQYCAAQGDGVVPGPGDVPECACVNYERSCITQPLLDGNYTYCEFLVEFAIAFGKATQQLWSSIQCWWPPCAPGTPNVLRPSAKLACCPDCIKVCIALIENVEVQNSSVNITAQCTLACPNNTQPVTTGHQVYCPGLTPGAGPPGPPGPPGPGPPGCPPTDPRCPGYKPTCPVTQPTCPGYNPCVNDPGSCPGYCPPTQFGCPGYLPTPAGPGACPPTQPGCPGYPCSPDDEGCPGYNACPPSTPGCPGYVPPTPYWVPAATYAGVVLLVGLIVVLAVVYSLRRAHRAT